MSVDPNHGSVQLNQSGASDWPQYVLRREERDHTLDKKVRKRPDSKRLASDRLLAACLISFLPVAASSIWIWSSIYVF